MPLRLDTTSPIPFYYQIREQLRQQITSGQLEPGDTLPSEAQLCTETGVSRMTARQALTQLANEGLVIRQRGRGTFVAAPKTILPNVQVTGMSYTEIMGQAGMSAGARVLAQEVLPASAEVAAQLRLATGERIIRIVRTRLAAGEIMSLETSFYPHSLFPDLAEADLTDASIYRFLEQRYGIAPAYAVDTIEISVAGAYEAENFKVNEGAPIVLVTTLGCLANDTPVVFTQTIHRGDRFRASLRRERRK
ncbi:MAG: GntR family transcriptional regulator [Anaerolineales bacterium]|nr:GntR family transcriptional regulator [Anaerolineales bacterium]